MGAQALLLSRRFVRAALGLWDGLSRGQDTRVIGVAATHRIPLWYTAPCLAEHVPRRSAFGTPAAYAPDFDPDFRLAVGPGFHPPEAVPGAPARTEGELLWRLAAGLDVLEVGDGIGGAVVCLAQSARRVTSVASSSQVEAVEWARRYGVADRVEFRRAEAAGIGTDPGPEFGLGVLGTDPSVAGLERDLAGARAALAPGGLIAVRNYPDPGHPDVRRVVDEHARRFGWRRIAQAGYLGVFATAGAGSERRT